ncbi:hypothetical protein KGY14_09635 [Ameyamaea chiangmaiensis]|uniref:Uncharacterized protein n=1 Tax=Ameyamaea chiangmaiensis TaxID=442969 RepID=A0A850P4Y9_9PROT|nr:hypothetical protein [Ameyamaea chiangmaiensis]MBS4075450.1 hypothetical protein [Ameyamaea chiangmaiensis]NVN39018.1 hypothetical protein [Ameyamaea chiangmaiensis]
MAVTVLGGALVAACVAWARAEVTRCLLMILYFGARAMQGHDVRMADRRMSQAERHVARSKRTGALIARHFTPKT